MKHIPYLCAQQVTFDSSNIAKVQALRYHKNAAGQTSIAVVDCYALAERNLDEPAIIDYLLSVGQQQHDIENIVDIQKGRTVVALNSRRSMANVILIHPETLKEYLHIMSYFQTLKDCEVFEVDIDSLKGKAISLYRSSPKSSLNTRIAEIDGAPILGTDGNRTVLLRDGASKYVVVQDFKVTFDTFTIGVRV